MLESVILDKGSQFVMNLIQELNQMLDIQTKLLTVFYSQTNSQTEHISQDLEQYLQFFMDYRQKNWFEQLVIAKFAINSKIHTATKISLFIANYRRKLQIGINIKKKRKMKIGIKLIEKIKKI